MRQKEHCDIIVAIRNVTFLLSLYFCSPDEGMDLIERTSTHGPGLIREREICSLKALTWLGRVWEDIDDFQLCKLTDRAGEIQELCRMWGIHLFCRKVPNVSDAICEVML